MNLQQFSSELEEELKQILQYWMRYAPDVNRGGFHGRIDNYNQCDPDAPKGSVLHARILWTFASACSWSQDTAYYATASNAFTYIQDHFVDREYGGVFWTVDANGRPLNTKKQVYALAFTIYACSAWYVVSAEENALQLSIDLYRLIQRHSHDPVNGGYLEAFARDWQPLSDLRLSEKDANEKKTMNTHLHVLEAYTALYRVWPDEELAKKITALLYLFQDRIMDPHTAHLTLFFDERWNRRSDTISFGHDIEAAWLLCEAADVLQHEDLIGQMRNMALRLAEAVIKGLDVDGGLWYEYEPGENKLIREKHWWPQAEVMVGFFHAWQISANEKYLRIVYNNWQFIQQHIRDKQHGEWFWGIDEHHCVMPGMDKAGLWKCPYHNSRACLEIMHRIAQMKAAPIFNT